MPEEHLTHKNSSHDILVISLQPGANDLYVDLLGQYNPEELIYLS